MTNANNYQLTGSASVRGTWTVICSNASGATLSDPWKLDVTLAGETIAWGDTSSGQTVLPYPLTNVVAIAAGQRHNLLLKEDGTVTACGSAYCGETNVPSGLNDVVGVGAGWMHSVALKADGTVVAWGDGALGQTNVPSGLSGVKAIAAGYYHNLALKTNGTVVAWGLNTHGQTNVPGTLTNAVAIAAGYQHSVALRSDGTVCAWGLDNENQCAVPSALSNVVAIAAGTWHSLALKSDATVVGWGSSGFGESTAPAGLSNILAIAAGGEYSLALKNDGTVVSWGIPVFGITNMPAPLGDVYAISAGFNHALALTYSPVLNYVIEPSRDLLLICNTNCADSVAVMNYYRTNRPMVANANVLGIGGATNAIERYADPTETTNTLVTPFLNWLTNNPTKRPNYVIMFYGVPASTIPYGGIQHYGGVASPSYTLWAAYPSRKPFITHINMRTPQDCFGYIDKLVHFGSNYSPGQIYISASTGGYGNTNYFFDDVRHSGFGPGYERALCASNGVVAFGASTAQITYVNCTNCTNYSLNLVNNTNVAGYLSWGFHSGWLGTGFPTNGWVRFYGSSGWSLVQIIESFSGQWAPFDYQTSFHDYFASTAFGGNNYSFTPVGTVTHVWEPGLSATCNADIALHSGGVSSPFLFFGLWHANKNFGICAWGARGTDRFQAVGDPFVTR